MLANPQPPTQKSGCVHNLEPFIRKTIYSEMSSIGNDSIADKIRQTPVNQPLKGGWTVLEAHGHHNPYKSPTLKVEGGFRSILGMYFYLPKC